MLPLFSSASLVAPKPVAGLALVALILALTGCVTQPVSYKTRPESASRVASLRRVAVAPPDIEVREISAGGVTEKRDDWSGQVDASLVSALANATGYAPSPPLDERQREELADVQALLRVLTINHLNLSFGPTALNPAARPLTFQVGRIDRLADACGADALLFVFARDAYSSGGRKALVVLGFAPPLPALASAMLIERDGTVLWFNYYLGEHTDLREADDAREFTAKLLAGLPRR